MVKKKFNLIKICLVIITIFVIANFLLATYFDIKNSIRDHDGRKTVCDGKGLVYLKSAQGSNEFVNCCEVIEGEITGCWEFLK